MTTDAIQFQAGAAGAAGAAPGWHELHRTCDASEANCICTVIAAMEFDVALDGPDACAPHACTPHGARGGRIVPSIDDHAEPVYTVQVRPEDYPALWDVLDELIAEQREFDAYLEHRDRKVGDAQRITLLAFVVVIGVLAAGKAIEL